MSANALTAGAVVFEALSEVDAKFSKIVDKEAENIGNEVKKWFKKLAVRAHLCCSLHHLIGDTERREES